jgi:sugar/nucleoside kinase (ribokinase family)
MLNRHPDPVDYLVIGHITCDLQPDGSLALGGTATYASLTAAALGLRPGVVTAYGGEKPLGNLSPLPLAGLRPEYSTTFENQETPSGRRQILRHIAPPIPAYLVPEGWRAAPLVHFAPVVDEVGADLLRLFPGSFIGLTPQGWLRSWDTQGRVSRADWLEAGYVLGLADAAVLSIEDIGGDWRVARSFAEAADVLVVTEGEAGCRVFLQGEAFRIPTTPLPAVDTTGAGDIFAAAFFVEYHQTGDALQAARFAGAAAGVSVTRRGMDGIPTADEIAEIRFPIKEFEWA